MKLNNLQKNFYIFFSVIISILIAALLWENINLPLNNTMQAKGLLVSKGYNPNNDTIRYIFSSRKLINVAIISSASAVSSSITL